MDKIFVVTKIGSLTEYDIQDINNFLSKNSDFSVKSITPFHQDVANNSNHGYYGMAVVVSDKIN